MESVKHNIAAEKIFVADDGVFPNNVLPVLHYVNVLVIPKLFAGMSVRSLFRDNGWYNAWSSGIFEYNHYHSNTFEVLGVISGSTRVLLGGDHGKSVLLNTGDVLIIPPGIAHRNLRTEDSIKCIGAYPDGIQYTMHYGKAGERPQTDHEIQRVAFPEKDPVFGTPFMEAMKTTGHAELSQQH